MNDVNFILLFIIKLVKIRKTKLVHYYYIKSYFISNLLFEMCNYYMDFKG